MKRALGLKEAKVTVNQLVANLPPLTGFSKLLVVAGYNLNDLNDAEVVDLGSEDADCVVKTGYPHDVFGVAGALLNGTSLFQPVSI